MSPLNEIVTRLSERAESLAGDFKSLPKEWQCAIGAVGAFTLVKLFWPARKVKAQGRRVVVTGAASGIGREVARILAAKGWRVWACDMNAKGLEEGLSEFANVKKCSLDVTSADSCAAVVNDITADGGSVDALVNVAGIIKQTPACGASDEDIRKVFEVNTIGPARLCRLLIPSMLKSPRGGWIVNVTSIGGRVAWMWTGSYSLSKAALNLYSDLIRREALASNLNLRVTVVAPGPVSTPMTSPFADNMLKYAKDHPNDPFAKGIQREAEFQQWLISRGWGVDNVAVTPHYVAERVVAALEKENPPTYEFVASVGFKVLMFFVGVLPTYYGDCLMTLL